MPISEHTNATAGLVKYALLIAALTAFTYYAYAANFDWLHLALLGPAMIVFAATGLEETVPVALFVAAVYFFLILLPTAVCLVRRKWTPGLIIVQAVLLVPNVLILLFVIMLSGVTG